MLAQALCVPLSVGVAHAEGREVVEAVLEVKPVVVPQGVELPHCVPERQEEALRVNEVLPQAVAL